jgi:hypothetical protein
LTASFEKLVSEALSSHGEKCSLQTRRFDDLDSFLFLPDEGFRQDNSAKQFDKLDFVFIGTQFFPLVDIQLADS